MGKFFSGVKSEMKQVTWPTGKVKKIYYDRFGTVFFFVIFFMIVDFGITSLLGLFIK